MQRVATHCAILITSCHISSVDFSTVPRCNTLQHIATHCNTLQHITTHCSALQFAAPYLSHRSISLASTLVSAATHCNTLQFTATPCNTLQRIAIRCTIPIIFCCVSVVELSTAPHCNTLQHTAAHCNTLQHTAAHCNTLHHTYHIDAYVLSLICKSHIQRYEWVMSQVWTSRVWHMHKYRLAYECVMFHICTSHVSC